MSNVSAHPAHPRRIPRDAESSLLRHWSDVLPRPANEPPPRVTPEIASVLRDLVSWAADLAVMLTNGCPDDRVAIEQVRAKTINNVLTVLGHLLHVAQERGLLVAVPKIKRVKAPPPKFDFLTFDEADRLIAHAEGEWRTMILVALRTGLRRGELLGLRWEDVDLVNGRLYVCENYVRGLFGVPKSGKPREVALSDEARRALAAHRRTRAASACSAMPPAGRSPRG